MVADCFKCKWYCMDLKTLHEAILGNDCPFFSNSILQWFSTCMDILVKNLLRNTVLRVKMHLGTDSKLELQGLAQAV